MFQQDAVPGLGHSDQLVLPYLDEGHLLQRQVREAAHDAPEDGLVRHDQQGSLARLDLGQDGIDATGAVEVRFA